MWLNAQKQEAMSRFAALDDDEPRAAPVRAPPPAPVASSAPSGFFMKPSSFSVSDDVFLARPEEKSPSIGLAVVAAQAAIAASAGTASSPGAPSLHTANAFSDVISSLLCGGGPAEAPKSASTPLPEFIPLTPVPPVAAAAPFAVNAFGFEAMTTSTQQQKLAIEHGDAIKVRFLFLCSFRERQCCRGAVQLPLADCM